MANIFQESLFRCGQMKSIAKEFNNDIVMEAYVVDLDAEQLPLPFEKDDSNAKVKKAEGP